MYSFVFFPFLILSSSSSFSSFSVSRGSGGGSRGRRPARRGHEAVKVLRDVRQRRLVRAHHGLARGQTRGDRRVVHPFILIFI
jgi:hypothetical protein